jgi:hypothetical protein
MSEDVTGGGTAPETGGGEMSGGAVVEAATAAYEALERDDVAPVVEDGGSTSDEGGSTPPAAPMTAAELSAAAKFLQEQGHGPTGRNGRQTWLPYKVTEGILTRFGDTVTKPLIEARTKLEQEMAEQRALMDQLRSGIEGDPEAFLRELAGLDPRYQRFVASQAAAAATTPAAVSAPPQPNVTLPDGSKTYDVEGLQALVQWAVEAKALPVVEERLKPITEREQRSSEEARVMRDIETRVRSQAEEAATWPGWADYEADIIAALQADSAQARASGTRPKLTLEAAYRQVALSKLSVNEAAVREKVLKELQGAPKSTAIGRSTPDAPRTPGPASVVDIAARTYERLERG